MILVNSPCNPTGSTYPVEVLRGLGRGVRVDTICYWGSDEVYEKLVYDHNGNYPLHAGSGARLGPPLRVPQPVQDLRHDRHPGRLGW